MSSDVLKGTAAPTPPGAARRRGNFLLGYQTVQRLGVHARLAGVDRSTAVDKILLEWLTLHGEGRYLFTPSEYAGQETPAAR